MEGDLPAIRDQMLGLAEQQASEVFLGRLRDLLAHRKVRFLDESHSSSDLDAAVIGKAVPREGLYELSINLALAAVQDQLRREGREALRVTERTLIEQLDAAGLIVPPETKEGKNTHQVRLAGEKLRCVRMTRAALGKGWRVDPVSRVSPDPGR